MCVVENKMLQHRRKVSKAELEAFLHICNNPEKLVLVPIVVNEQDRFCLVSLSGSKQTGVEGQILGMLPLPADQVMGVDGETMPILVKETDNPQQIIKATQTNALN